MSDVTIVREGWLQKRGKYIQYLSSSSTLPLCSLLFFSASCLDWGPGCACPHVPVGGCECLRLSVCVWLHGCLSVRVYTCVRYPPTGMCLFIISLAGCLFAKPLCASVSLKKSVCMGMCMCVYVQLITSTRPVVTLLMHSVLSVCKIKLVLPLWGIIYNRCVLSCEWWHWESYDRVEGSAGVEIRGGVTDNTSCLQPNEWEMVKTL